MRIIKLDDPTQDIICEFRENVINYLSRINVMNIYYKPIRELYIAAISNYIIERSHAILFTDDAMRFLNRTIRLLNEGKKSLPSKRRDFDELIDKAEAIITVIKLKY